MTFSFIRVHFRLAVAIGAVFLTATVVSFAAQAPEAGIDPQADKVLQAMSRHLADLHTYTFRVNTLHDHVEKSGIKIKIGQQAQIFINQPDRLHIRSHWDNGAHLYVWYDGRTLVRSDNPQHTYSKIPAPKSIDELIDHLTDTYDVNLPVADFFLADIYASFKEYLLSGEYLGQRMVDGVLTHHLSFESLGVDFQLWVTVGDKPLPRRFVITYVNSPGEPELMATFEDWDVPSYVGEGMFRYTIPEGAKEVPLVPLTK